MIARPRLDFEVARFAGICTIALVLVAMAGSSGATAGEARVAVAANVLETAREIGRAFAAATGHNVSFSAGATGQLYAQISQGAPYDVFLAADAERPRRAIEEGFAVVGSRFPYAVGRLALYSARAGLVTGPGILEAGGFDKIAIANPQTAPYGAAAIETLQALGAYDRLKDRIVQGNSIAQAYQFVASGNVDLGFVALPQLAGGAGGSHWIVPDDLHAPIRQDAVLLARGADNEAAREFLTFLRGEEARTILARAGYDLPGIAD